VSAAAETALLATRGLQRFLRNPQLLVDTLALPLLLLFMMLAVFGHIVGSPSAPYVQRLTPAVVLFSTASGSVVTGIGFFTDLHSGMSDRLRTMPINRVSPLLGRLTGDLVRVLIAAVVTCAVAYLVGFRFERGPMAALGFFLLVAGFASISVWIALVVALTARNEEELNSVLTAPATLLLFFSTGFAPLGAFPGFLQPAVAANPLSCASNVAIGLTSGGQIAVPLWQTAGWVAGVTALAAPAAMRLYHRRNAAAATR
jgi:ABC-2 type transport system permease protein